MVTKSSNPDLNIFERFYNAVIHKRIRVFRLASQIFFFLVFNGVIIGLSRTAIPVPVVLPPSAPFSTAWGGFEALQYVLTRGQFPFLVLGMFFLTGALVGRFFCGWACPFGLYQDMLSWIPAKKSKVPRPLNRDLQELAWYIIGFSLMAAFFVGLQRYQGQTVQEGDYTSIPFGPFDPAGFMFVQLFYILKLGLITSWDTFKDVFKLPGGFYTGLRALIFIGVSILAIKVPRAYCRWMCPTGAILGYCGKYSMLGVSRDPIKCEANCSACEDACPMGVPILDYSGGRINDTLCINCGACIDACGETQAIKFVINV